VIESKLVQNGQPVEYGEASWHPSRLENTGSQPRRDRAAHYLRVQGSRHPHRGRLFRSRPAQPAGALRRSGHLHRPREERAQLSGYSSIISAAEITNVDAIHPGYGFSAKTRASPKSAGFPASNSSTLAGSDFRYGVKERARTIMRNTACRFCRVRRSAFQREEAVEIAAAIAIPSFSKPPPARRRRMRIVNRAENYPASGTGAAGSGRVLLQRRRLSGKIHRRAASHRIPDPGRRARHVEILGERECSIQSAIRSCWRNRPRPH